MDSIANHYTTMRPRKPSVEESPEQKRTAAHNRELTGSAMKRRRTDAEGGKVELGLSGVRDKGRALFRRMRKSDEKGKSDENHDSNNNEDKKATKPSEKAKTSANTPTATTATDGKVSSTKGNVKISTVPLNDTVSGSSSRLRASKSMTRLNGGSKTPEPPAAGALKQSKSTGRGLSRLTQETTASLSKMTDKKLSKSKSYASLSPGKKAPLTTVSPSRVDDMLNQLPNTTHAPERTAKMLNKLPQPPSKIPTRTQRLNNTKSTPNLRKQH
ncbi:hypothetical protein TRICI_003377 [Trichomonascus ciferrii]|uniref:Uncharacterized protein n=1 Tax=Trichomonascus ciferrii TaxID=44093 RepID=A0A642V3Y8_9ASCO|nr:hypothetical protein TRICI_003377 [Trichomonascus ciferrii]